MTKPILSIVIPAYNEAAAIADVIQEAHDVVSAVFPIELIVVDDGSDDGMADAAKTAIDGFEAARVIRHPKRSGKSAALRTGMIAAEARWVATMDGDGQDNPADIVAMAKEIDLMRIGPVGLIAGNRKARTDGSARKYASRFANRLRRTLLDDDCPDTACGLKIIPRDLFLALPFFDALHRYLPALVKNLGYGVVNVPVTNRPRATGVSKYSNVGRAAAGLFDLCGVIWLMRRTHTPSPDFVITETFGRDADQ